MRPVVLVHGIWDSSRSVGPMARALERQGVAHVRAIDLAPAWGNAPLEQLAAQLADFVTHVRREHAAPSVDLVGFSMGALVARAYLQLLDGAPQVRTFVSISAPHRGTLTAYGLPLVGARQMRPGSAFLRALGHDVSHLSEVAVHCLYTPFDAMILPAESSVLVGARSVHRIPVALHRWMLSDARVHTLVGELLRG